MMQKGKVKFIFILVVIGFVRFRSFGLPVPLYINRLSSFGLPVPVYINGLSFTEAVVALK